VRAYEVWPTKNVFCCWGHLMTGPIEDIGPNSCAWGSLLSPMAIFFFVWGDVLWNPEELPPAYAFTCCFCFASAIFWFVVTSFTDPGIIPRGPRPEKPPPGTRQVIDPLSGAVHYETWCTTCNIYRPPRASHCSDCDNCVRDFDHHCPFTRNCIGRRNYGPFVMFLCSTCASLAVVLVSGILLPTHVKHLGNVDPNTAGLREVLNTLALMFCLVMAALLFSFTTYHMSLICSGMTTKEHLKGKRSFKQETTFQRLCEPCAVQPSELAPREMVQIGIATFPSSTVPVISSSQL